MLCITVLSKTPLPLTPAFIIWRWRKRQIINAIVYTETEKSRISQWCVTFYSNIRTRVTIIWSYSFILRVFRCLITWYSLHVHKLHWSSMTSIWMGTPRLGVAMIHPNNIHLYQQNLCVPCWLPENNPTMISMHVRFYKIILSHDIFIC